jgi:hypothetical protein
LTSATPKSLPAFTTNPAPLRIPLNNAVTHSYNGVAMRIFIICLITSAATLSFAPGAQDLRKHYGEPDTERFIARPGISLTVQYASDHLACEMLIESPRQLLLQKNSEGTALSPEKVTEILDEVVPVSTRGKQLNQVVAEAGCNVFTSTIYENVSITRATHECLPLQPDRESNAAVTFNRNICRSEFK